MRPTSTARLLLLLTIARPSPLRLARKSESPGKPSISVFASPDDAGNALLAAAKSGDQNALLAILAPIRKSLSPLAIRCRKRMPLPRSWQGMG